MVATYEFYSQQRWEVAQNIFTNDGKNMQLFIRPLWRIEFAIPESQKISSTSIQSFVLLALLDWAISGVYRSRRHVDKTERHSLCNNVKWVVYHALNGADNIKVVLFECGVVVQNTLHKDGARDYVGSFRLRNLTYNTAASGTYSVLTISRGAQRHTRRDETTN